MPEPLATPMRWMGVMHIRANQPHLEPECTQSPQLFHDKATRNRNLLRAPRGGTVWSKHAEERHSTPMPWAVTACAPQRTSVSQAFLLQRCRAQSITAQGNTVIVNTIRHLGVISDACGGSRVNVVDFFFCSRRANLLLMFVECKTTCWPPYNFTIFEVLTKPQLSYI